ncbi:MAG: ABC transporter substrate-binding protein [Enterobacterales bacterium endosymbiont of Blomia tropicalis]|uniref:ABC transporter substrate-binding protein n=1 Tax=Mixta mediterraneensis TaxID=2758443 RepID=UPI0025A89E13|nr:ABC transporter substrate-binding protein [Mixta mediterraneensis]MDL4915088.1 ABC transporter substrate-binding protein [Mixta mediterraneensis]
MAQTINRQRRQFLRNSALLGLGFTLAGTVPPFIARAAATRIRIAVNPGLENATLTALMNQQEYFKQFDADVQIVEAHGTAGPFEAITQGAADLCMTSGYNGLLTQIAQGARVSIVGAGMKKSALTVYTKNNNITTLHHLNGKTVAVGPPMGLLHVLMLELLKEKGIDASQVNFVNKGSNNACYQAVVKGEADACCASISHLNNRDGLTVISEGNMWQSLPKYTFQTAYASDAALRDKHEGMVAVMAAYGALYNYLMSPAAHDAFFEARRRAAKKFNEASAQAVWNFIQEQRPYSSDLSLTESDIDYQQQIYIDLGSIRQKLPFSAVADMSVARAAAKRLVT